MPMPTLVTPSYSHVSGTSRSFPSSSLLLRRVLGLMWLCPGRVVVLCGCVVIGHGGGSWWMWRGDLCAEKRTCVSCDPGVGIGTGKHAGTRMPTRGKWYS